jgi:two-component system, sensor histidine kinase YesM
MEIIVKILSNIIRRIQNLGIGGRITFFYCILLITSLTISSLLYQKIYSDIMLKKVSSVSMQTLQSISSNVRSLFFLVNNYSKMILANQDVRNVLKSGKGYINVEDTRRVSEFMEIVMASFSEISSLYLVDNEENRFFRDKFPNHYQYFNSDKDSRWWRKASELRGESYFVLNGSDSFTKPLKENFISNIRIINNIDDQLPIGAVIINISEKLFIKAYSEIAKNYETKIVFLDENNNNIINSLDISTYRIAELLEKAGEKDSFFVNFKEDKQLYSYLKIEKYNWKILSIIPFGEVTKESRIFMFVSSVVIIVIAALILIGSVIITGIVTRPINLLVASMKEISIGTLNKVEFYTSIIEFIRLRDGYNLMIEEIHTLVNKTIEEEKIKRKAEMDILQAQIKPHFLYNTFDSISSLALMGRNDDIYKIMTALGSYYRISLSKGKEIITIEEEVETVRNYLDILKVRYKDIFSVVYDCDESLQKSQILKLVLQPFAENAIYHGIKPKGEKGVILIKTWREGSFIKLMVKDDGVGMNDKESSALIEEINTDGKTISFGIKGTIKRLQLFCGRDDVYLINSKKGFGTEIIITIPDTEGCLYER